MLIMFFCIAVGFIMKKSRILPDSSGKVLSKLVTWVFSPALNFLSMSTNFTVEKLGTHSINVILCVIAVGVAIGIAIPLSRLFIKEKNAERGIYAYALAFANSGYMGDPVVKIIFGEANFTYYKVFCLPVSIGIYSWGMSQLVPKGANKKSFLASFFNAPMVATMTGMVVGITGLGAYLPDFITGSLEKLSGCMGPAAMLVAGFTIASYSILGMLKKPKVYVATLLRLTLLPAIIIAAVFGAKELINYAFNVGINNDVLYLVFFSVATPLGLNTVVFPEAYGGNPETGASMAMISHTLCVLSIPLLYALMTVLFGQCTLYIL